MRIYEVPSVAVRLLAVLVVLWTSPAHAVTADGIAVESTGQAPIDLPGARAAAINDALRRCVEAGAGVALTSTTETRDFALVRDAILVRSAGYVQQYDVLRENRDQDGLYTVLVRATVSRGEIDEDAMALRALMKRKGRPKLMVLAHIVPSDTRTRIPERIGGATTDPDPEPAPFIEAALQGQLEQHGLDVLDKTTLDENRRREADRAARVEGNLRKAASIASEIGADVLAVVTLTVEPGEPAEVYGIEQHPVTAVAIVKLIDAATARVLGSEVAEVRRSARSAAKAHRAAMGEAAEQAMDQAVGRLARHWLEDVDPRGGATIELALHEMTHRQVSALRHMLRAVPGIQDTILDNVDPGGVTRLRIVTNASSADVAAVIEQLDSKLKVKRLSASSIELQY